MNDRTCTICNAGENYLIRQYNGTQTILKVVCCNCSNAVDTLTHAQSIATTTRIGVGNAAPIPRFTIGTAKQN